MSYEPVTTAQTNCLSKGANEEMGYVPLRDARIEELTKLAQKVGARIRILRRVRVKQDREWQEVVNLAGPNAPDHHYVRKLQVSCQYQPISNKVVEKDIVLLNYPKDNGNLDMAVAWSTEAKVNSANPREVTSVVEQNPNLHTLLGQKVVYLVSPTECTFGGGRRAFYVWLRDSNREAALIWIGHMAYRNDWFAFCE